MARSDQLYEQIKKDTDVRRNLIQLRQNITDESLRKSFLRGLGGDYSVFLSLLSDEDPKVRKNAALILGMTRDESMLPALLDAWKREETLFVREEYLKAIAMCDYREILPELQERIGELEEAGFGNAPIPETADASEQIDETQTESDCTKPSEKENPLWDNEKHMLSELSRLRAMIARYEKNTRHTFDKWDPAPNVVLLTNRLHADVTAKQISSGMIRQMKGAVHVKGGNLREITKIRTWIEMLFTIPGARPITGDEKQIAQRLRDLKIGNYLKYLHQDSDQPFRYRIELKSASMPREKKGEFIRRIASRLDALEGGILRNSDSDYEVELRLIERGDRSIMPMLKLYTIPDTRFAYRKETTAQSTASGLCAIAVSLGKPYMKENAQILDPFCGTGGLLIERNLILKADPIYGIDRFGEAVEKARRNTGALPEHTDIHYINRDFFDFTHDYPFDEIITELPKMETDAGPFAEQFLKKAKEVLADEAILILLTDAPGELQRAMQNVGGYTEKASFLLNEKAGTFEKIIQFNR